jgi:TPR repeat protein
MVRRLRVKAEGGDGWAMYTMGVLLMYGKWGVRKDRAEAFRWCQRSADAGCEDGVALLGHCYMQGHGVGKNNSLGLTYVTEGATRGAQYGCYRLGCYFAKALHGLPKDDKQATKWYRKMQACTNVTVSASCKEEAAAWLHEHATD